MDKSGDTEKVKGFINNRNMCLKFGTFNKHMLNPNNTLSWWRKRVGKA